MRLAALSLALLAAGCGDHDPAPRPEPDPFPAGDIGNAIFHSPHVIAVEEAQTARPATGCSSFE